MVGKTIMAATTKTSSSSVTHSATAVSNPLMLCKRLSCGLLVLFMYLILGGFIFHYLESGREENLRDRTLKYAYQFLRNNTCVSMHEALDFANEIKYAVNNGLNWNNGHGEELNETMFGHHTWDFANSMFFSCTVVTTIGYGNMAPRTVTGRIVCICYAIIGIPLLMVVLTSFNRLYAGAAKKHNKTWERLLRTSCRSQRCRKAIVILFCFVVTFLLLIVLPSFIIIQFENWDMITGIYYTFMSITTVGFGDYVAGNGRDLSYAARVAYKVCLMIYLIYGFALLTFTFNFLTAGNQNQRSSDASPLAPILSVQKHFKVTRDALSTDEVQLVEHSSAISATVFHDSETDLNNPILVDRSVETATNATMCHNQVTDISMSRLVDRGMQTVTL